VRPMLTEAQLETALAALHKCLGESIQRRSVRRAAATVDEDYDDEAREGDAEAALMEHELVMNISDVVTVVLKTHGPRAYAPLCRTVMPRLVQMAHPNCIEADRTFAVYILVDVLEHCAQPLMAGATGLEDLRNIVHVLLGGATRQDNGPPLLQAAAYGLGAFGRLGPQVLGAFPEEIPQAVDALAKLMAKRGDGTGVDGVCDNAAAAYGFLCEHAGADFAPWLAYLPLKADDEEAANTAAQLARLVGGAAPVLLGAQLERGGAAVAAAVRCAQSRPADAAQLVAAVKALGLVPGAAERVPELAQAVGH